MYRIFTLSALLIALGCNVNAQSLSNLFGSSAIKDVVNSVTGGIPLSASQLAGEWYYVGSAVELESDNMLTTAAGALTTSQLEGKLDEICAKVGIAPGLFTYSFYSDGTFRCQIKSRSIGGTYTIDSANKQILFNFTATSLFNMAPMKASATVLAGSLTLMFEADKLLKFITTLSSISDNQTLALLNSVATKYNGLKLGFELSREVQVAPESSSTGSIAGTLIESLKTKASSAATNAKESASESITNAKETATDAVKDAANSAASSAEEAAQSAVSNAFSKFKF